MSVIGVLAVVPKGVLGNSLYLVAKRLVTALPEFTLTDNANALLWLGRCCGRANPRDGVCTSK
jgi:hypothetical protein